MQSNDQDQPKSFDISGSPHAAPPKRFGPEIGPMPVEHVHRAPTAGSGQSRQPEPIIEKPVSFIGDAYSIDDEDPSNEAATKRRKRDEFKNMIYTIGLFILAPLFAVFMIVFVFQSYVVDGSSMQPTLQNGNRVFILKLPKTIASLQNKPYIPARNEVIVFKKPGNEGTQLIKRVVGLPGDRVVIKNGIITIYNLDYPSGFNPDVGTDHEGELEPVDTQGEVIETNVGEGELFVLGDNRGPGGSLDSHSGLGLVPVETIVGRLWVRYFPISEFQVFAKSFTPSYFSVI